MTSTTTLSAAELEDAVRNGDTSISAEDIAAARLREEHAALLAEGERRAHARAVEDERARAVAQLRADIDAVQDTHDEQIGYAIAATAALEDLLNSVQARADTIRELGDRARSLGIPAIDGQNNTAGDTGLGWKLDQSTRRITRLRTGDRILGSVEPRHVLNRVIHELLAGRKISSTDHVPHKPLTDLLADQDHVIVPPTMTHVRLLTRHGHRPAGTVTAYDEPTARWLIGKRMAEPA